MFKKTDNQGTRSPTALESLVALSDVELDAVGGVVSVRAEREACGPVNLLSDMGGQLGLWMGISVITRPDDPACRQS